MSLSLETVVREDLKIPFDWLVNSPLATDKQLCAEIQTRLKPTHFYTLAVDGIYGKGTFNAIETFKLNYNLPFKGVIDRLTASWMLDFDKLALDKSALVKPNLTRDDIIEAIIKECKRHRMTLKTQIAYVLATTEHETNNTFLPVREAYWLSEAWRKANLRYYPWYGRGFIQTTWYPNYLFYEELTGVPFTKEPDLVLNPTYALYLLVDGMSKGRYTTKRLGDYVNVDRTDFLNARRVVNGVDKQQLIAGYANEWLRRI